VARAVVTREDVRGAGLDWNTSPGVVADPGTDEPLIARIVQIAAGAARWVAVQLAGAAFPRACGAPTDTLAPVMGLQVPWTQRVSAQQPKSS
jgi:hypothetical protein